METALESGGATWEQAAQGWGSMLLDRYTAATFVPPSQTPLANTQRGSTGQTYTEGQPTAPGAGMNIGGLKITPVLLLGAAAVAVFLLLRKG